MVRFPHLSAHGLIGTSTVLDPPADYKYHQIPGLLMTTNSRAGTAADTKGKCQSLCNRGTRHNVMHLSYSLSSVVRAKLQIVQFQPDGQQVHVVIR